MVAGNNRLVVPASSSISLIRSIAVIGTSIAEASSSRGNRPHRWTGMEPMQPIASSLWARTERLHRHGHGPLHRMIRKRPLLASTKQRDHVIGKGDVIVS